MDRPMILEQAVDKLEDVLEENACRYYQEIVDNVIRLIPNPVVDEDDEKQLIRALKVIRKWRCFELLQDFCIEVLPFTKKRLETVVRTYWAQAQIDLGQPDNARRMLEYVEPDLESNIGKREKSEVIGLLGRAHKDLFLLTNDIKDLELSIGYYEKGFPLDAPWHGANLVALVSFSERAGIKVGHSVSSKEWSEKLIKKLGERDEEYWSPWEFAAASEAYLARNNSNAAKRYIKKYWRSANNPFMLAGTERQLRTLWHPFNTTERQELITNLATNLEAFRLSMVGTSETYTPHQLAELASRMNEASGIAEAVHGTEPAIPLNRILRLLKIASRVCRIADPDSGKSGTAFLVNGEDLCEKLTGQKVLLTNNHVLHDMSRSDPVLADESYEGSMNVKRAVAEFHYWGGKEEIEIFPLSKVIYSSPRNLLDFSVVTFESEPVNVNGINLNDEKEPFPPENLVSAKQRGKVFVIGHPEGKDLSFSVADNEVVDHELTNKTPRINGLRRIHYRAPTQPGSSGSPVLHHQYLDVVGLHRSGSVKPMRDPWPGKAQGQVPYKANEAVSICSIREYIAGL